MQLNKNKSGSMFLRSIQDLVFLFIIIFLILFSSFSSQAQVKNLFKYSTFYASASMASPFAVSQQFYVDGVAGSGQLVEITEQIESNYVFSIGLRKVARFDYQVKKGRFYDGSENEISDYATISNAPGLEYLFEYSAVRNRGDVFTQQEYKVRYIHNRFAIKAAYVNDGLINLKYTLGEIRYRQKLGNLDLTAGIAHRSHPVYGYSPVNAWFAIPANKHWWQLANEFGYFSDPNQHWTKDGELIAKTDREFYTYHFGRAVTEYNNRELEALGLVQELSAVFGFDYYYNKENFWIHGWSSFYPIHKGLNDFSYIYPDKKFEWDAGLILGSKINKHLGLFIEGRHLKFWDIKSYQMKAGVNYLIF